MYAILCTRSDICYAIGMVSKYQSNPGLEHWTAEKHIFKYLRRTRDYMLTYRGSNLISVGYTDSGAKCDILWTSMQVGVHWILYAHMSKYLTIIWNEILYYHTLDVIL